MFLCCSEGHRKHFKLSVCPAVLGQRVGVNSPCLMLARFVPVATVSGVSCSFM